MKRLRKVLKKYFIPHLENDHKPHILRARTVAFVLLIALLAEGALLFGTSQLAPRSGLFGIIVANTLIDETNQNRLANDESALVVSPLLTTAAQEKADDMVANNYFAHTSPAGLTPWYWFQQVGYGFTYAGENLAVNFSDSADVTNAWMNSAEHRANILNVSFTQIGIATAKGTYEGHPAVYVVELFGTPVPPAPSAEALPFVNAAAASNNTNATSVAITKTPTKPVTKPAPKPVPTVVATSGLQTASTTTTTVAATSTIIVAGSITGAGPGAANDVQPQTNPIQKAAANPRAIVDYIYLAIIALFSLALGINIFVKVRIQHPQVIFGGMLVILVAGLLIVLNQHVLVGAAIL